MRRLCLMTAMVLGEFFLWAPAFAADTPAADASPRAADKAAAQAASTEADQWAAKKAAPPEKSEATPAPAPEPPAAPPANPKPLVVRGTPRPGLNEMRGKLQSKSSDPKTLRLMVEGGFNVEFTYDAGTSLVN